LGRFMKWNGIVRAGIGTKLAALWAEAQGNF